MQRVGLAQRYSHGIKGGVSNQYIASANRMSNAPGLSWPVPGPQLTLQPQPLATGPVIGPVLETVEIGSMGLQQQNNLLMQSSENSSMLRAKE